VDRSGSWHPSPKLSSVGVVIFGASASSSALNPGTRFTASILAQSEWGQKSIHCEGGAPLFRGQMEVCIEVRRRDTGSW